MMKLYYIAAMDMLSFAMIVPIFSSYLYSLDPSRTVMGFVMSSESLIKVLWNPIAGSLSDTTGRKYMIVQSLILLCISNILMTVSSSLLVIFLARFCSALGSQLQSLLRITISEHAKDNQRFAALNKLGAVHSLCFITGVILGGFLSETKNGVTYIFAIVSLLTLFSTGIMQSVLRYIKLYFVPAKKRLSSSVDYVIKEICYSRLLCLHCSKQQR